MLPDLGYTPWRADQKAWELHLSHWRRIRGGGRFD
jgi:hypothetical protein